MGLVDAIIHSDPKYWEAYAAYMVEKTGLGAIIRQRLAWAAEARAAALVAEISKLRAASIVAGGGGLALTLGVPMGAWVGVWAALGAPYAQATALVRNENFQSGFSQGFVTGLLKWDWSHTVARFGKFSPGVNTVDSSLGFVASNAFNGGLRTGYEHAHLLDDAKKKEILGQLKSASPNTKAGNWSRLDQISYVIDLAAAGRKNSLFRL